VQAGSGIGVKNFASTRLKEENGVPVVNRELELRCILGRMGHFVGKKLDIYFEGRSVIPWSTRGMLVTL